MTYPEGTRLVVWYSHLPSMADYPCFATVLPDGSAHVHFRNGNKTVSAKGRAIVRESAAKCAERMLEMLKRYSSWQIVDNKSVRALIAEAEGKDAK